MEEKIGVVKEVFIPADNKDVINPKTIGFKVEINGKIMDIIQPIDDEVSTVFKNDLVYVDYKTIGDTKIYKTHNMEDGELYE